MCCSSCSTKQRKFWIFGCGSLIGCLALVLVLLWPQWGENILDSELVIKKGSLLYNNWLETPIPIKMEIHFFNWTNPNKINDKTEKPVIEERGPYVFLEKHKRVNLTWNDNGTVSYNQIRTWYFDPSSSAGGLEDMITSVNPISATVANLMKDQVSIVKDFINILLNTKGGSLTTIKSARAFLFDGYDDPLLSFLKKFNTSAFDIPYSKFGWFVDRNNSDTYDGRFTMNTGQSDFSSLGLVTRWNGKNETGFFDGKCGDIHGTTGEVWPPKLNQYSPKSIFVSDLCRSITLKYNDKFMKNGVEGSQWIGDEQLFDNGHLFQENRCFCLAKDFSECPPTGILDISNCKFGAPAAMSYPHFYMADQSYGNAVSGLNPNKSLHEFTMALEPRTGIPLDLAARIQLNMYIKQDSHLDLYKDVKNVLMPVFWFAQRVTLTEDLAGDVKLALLVPEIGVYISYGLFGIALLIISIGIALTLTKSWACRSVDNSQMLLAEET